MILLHSGHFRSGVYKVVLGSRMSQFLTEATESANVLPADAPLSPCRLTSDL